MILLASALLMGAFISCSDQQIAATTTSFNNPDGSDGTSSTSGILGEDDTDTLTQRSEVVIGLSTTESLTDSYHMMLGIGSSVPMSCLKSEDGLEEIESSLTF